MTVKASITSYCRKKVGLDKYKAWSLIKIVNKKIMLTFNEKLEFSNGFSASKGCAPEPNPRLGCDGKSVDWFDGMYDDGEQIDPITGKNYVKEDLEKAIFDKKLSSIVVTWYENSYMYGNSTDTDVSFSFHAEFDKEYVTFRDFLVAINDGFSKKIRECEARVMIEDREEPVVIY